MHGANGLSQTALICQEVQALADSIGAPSVDGECGLHIHLNANDMKPRQLSNLFVLLHRAEPIIYAMYPKRNPQYCAPIDINMRLGSRFRDWVDVRDAWYRGQNNVKDKNHTYQESFINGTQPGDHWDGTRYHGFNIHCFWRQGTVEFRYGAGTLDPLHIRAYYEMCLALMNTAMSEVNIKSSDSLNTYKYQQLLTYYQQNYRFRKIIKHLCKDCSFSRGTIKLIMDLIRENNPAFLAKSEEDKEKFVVITGANSSQFLYRTKDGKIRNSSGTVQQSVNSKFKIIDCDYYWASEEGAYQLISTNRNIILEAPIYIWDASPDVKVNLIQNNNVALELEKLVERPLTL